MAIVQIAHSTVTAHAPVLGFPGQIAINEIDRKLFYRDPNATAIAAGLEQFVAVGGVANTASVSFVFPTRYTDFRATRLALWDIVTGSTVSDPGVQLRCSTNGGSTFDSTSNYQWGHFGGFFTNNTGATGTDTSVELMNFGGPTSDRGALEIFFPVQSGGYQNIYYNNAWSAVGKTSPYTMNGGAGGGVYRNTGVNAVQVFCSTGNITLKYAMSEVMG